MEASPSVRNPVSLRNVMEVEVVTEAEALRRLVAGCSPYVGTELIMDTNR